MEFKGVLKLQRYTVAGMQYRATVDGLPLPLNVFVPGAKGLQKEGSVVIDISSVKPAAKPKAVKPKGKGKK
ncbi:MAG: hypothetical protein ABIJ57_16335 [Pseudomonadota bacterium]